MFVDEAVNRLHELEHIQMGGTNLLKATALKKNMDYINVWRISNYISIDENKLTPHGNRSFHFYVEDNTTNYVVGQSEVNLLSNTAYTFSAWIMLDSTATDNENINFQISYLKPDGNTVWRNEDITTNMLTKGKWIFISKTITTGEIKDGTKATASIQVYRNKWHGYVGDIKLELGSHYTDWSPNPHDLVLWDNPIGSVKMMGSDVKPSETIGGTWIQTCQARNPIGVGTTKDVNNISKTFQLGSTGGEFTHTQTINELVPHTHGQHIINDGGLTTGKTYRCDYQCDGLAVSVYPQNIETMSTGGGKPMNIVSPFQAFYFWMRTA